MMEFDSYKNNVHDVLAQLGKSWQEDVREAGDGGAVWANQLVSGISDLVMICEGALSRDGLHQALGLYDAGARGIAQGSVLKLRDYVRQCIGDQIVPTCSELEKQI